ncbi:unnamed protein product [Rangifer tarandus platyrhynchus]|uniref:Uncharacterized protein n=1 Tax=Rangifer tarandus platyrhynchus TaxID=3082113 RepID=A0ABN8Y8M9_RANTA|nr:unnamed protein product [Rangifer tarandus platyrhynchus]
MGSGSARVARTVVSSSPGRDPGSSWSSGVYSGSSAPGLLLRPRQQSRVWPACSREIFLVRDRMRILSIASLAGGQSQV